VLRLKTYIMTHYETVFILNPVLSEEQIKETVKKFESFLVSKGAKMISKEDWGLKKLAYPIQHKKSGFYHLFEFTSDGEPIGDLEVEFRRDERIMRYLTVKLDKLDSTPVTNPAVHVESAWYLVNKTLQYIVANDENYALAA
jgi:small subunit ribosomal protein S6